MMGLYDSAYWLSWLTWEGILTVLSSLFTVLFGMLFQFDFFLKNSFAVVFLLFYLFQINMVNFFLATLASVSFMMAIHEYTMVKFQKIFVFQFFIKYIEFREQHLLSQIELT
jgi:hypothetical protein